MAVGGSTSPCVPPGDLMTDLSLLDCCRVLAILFRLCALVTSHGVRALACACPLPVGVCASARARAHSHPSAVPTVEVKAISSGRR